MNQRAKLQSVMIADLTSGAGRPVRQPRESAVDHARRLMLNDELDCNESDQFKVLRYASALACGEQFPPILVFKSDGELRIGDGYHRAAATAWLGRKTISAVVIEDWTGKEADRLTAMFYDLEFNRTTTLKALELVAAAYSEAAP